MKKIQLVVTKSNWGGAQRYVFDLAKYLPKDRFDVSVAYGKRGLLAEKLEQAGIKMHSLGAMQRDVAFGADVRAFFELYCLFKSERPDVVHLNSNKAGILGALAARASGVPKIIFTDHGWAFAERRSAPARAAIWLVSWLTALLVHRIICVSDYELRLTCGMPFVGYKAVRIYNGIDLHMQFGSGEKIRTAFPAGTKITGTVGELTKNKNQIALIKQARKNPAMCVAIVGEGEDRTMLERKIMEYGLQDRVKLFGFTPASEALRGFDVFALPSNKEALGYAVLEARAAGLPIEAARVGGIPEALERPLSDFSLERMVTETAALY